jgi:predicted secreted protein
MALAMILSVAAGVAAAQAPPEAVSPGARWEPDPGTVRRLTSGCANAPALDTCRAKVLQAAGAPPAAVAFAERTGYTGFLRDYRTANPVAVAYVVYPFRANENSGVLLVNGSPPTIDVDDPRMLDTNDLAADPLYASLLRGNPGLAVFPGDRFDTRYPVSMRTPDDGRRFLVVYQLQTCHACAQVGQATVAFDFAADGRFDGTRLWAIDVDAAGTPAASQKPVTVSASPPGPVELALGQQLIVSLTATAATGYQWRLAEPFDQTVVRFTSSQHEASTTSGVGAPGAMHLGFTPVGRGTATIALEYVRPWERGVAPARSVRIPVVVR